jgi:hypothetical protein
MHWLKRSLVRGKYFLVYLVQRHFYQMIMFLRIAAGYRS